MLWYVSGKKRRLTIIECNNDINCMIDIAKIADLVSDTCMLSVLIKRDFHRGSISMTWTLVVHPSVTDYDPNDLSSYDIISYV